MDFIDFGPFSRWDKVAHGTEYGLFCLLLLRGLRGTFPSARGSTIAVWAVLIAAAYGASDEFHQSFVPGRDPDVFDFLADTGGATVVSVIWYLRGRGESAPARTPVFDPIESAKKHPKV
jgi:VanZ family protein